MTMNRCVTFSHLPNLLKYFPFILPLKFQERTKAESMLVNFLTNIENLPKLTEIALRTDSDTVLFVTCELLYKIIVQTRFEVPMNSPFNRDEIFGEQNSPNAATVAHFYQLYELFLKVLLEKCGKLKPFTINSIANLLGGIIKKIWIEIKENQALIERIKPFFFSQV